MNKEGVFVVVFKPWRNFPGDGKLFSPKAKKYAGRKEKMMHYLILLSSPEGQCYCPCLQMGQLSSKSLRHLKSQ
jgi:hypothetical protein